MKYAARTNVRLLAIIRQAWQAMDSCRNAGNDANKAVGFAEALAACREVVQASLPQIADLHRAGIDITHGQDSVEYVRQIREAEDTGGAS